MTRSFMKFYILATQIIFLIGSATAQNSDTLLLENSNIKATFSQEGLIELVNPSDSFQANFVKKGGQVKTKLTYKDEKNNWIDLEYYRDSISLIRNIDSSISILTWGPHKSLNMEQRYSLSQNGLDMDIYVQTATSSPVIVGDLGISLPYRSPAGNNQVDIYERSFVKHHFISGNGSFLYFTKPSGNGPFLMMLPKADTQLEYFDNKGDGYVAYIHSFLSANNVGGTWRQPNTKISTENAKDNANRLHYGFRFRWANDWEDMRRILYDEGLFDIRVVPGMTLPSNLSAQFSLHTKNNIDSITTEFPQNTSIKYIGQKIPHHDVYEVSFEKLGENLLTIHYGGAKKTYLEFFSTEPLETLIKKRSAFIVNHQQHRDTTKWYNGLFSAYDMKNGVLRGPDNTDGFDEWWGYVLASDDAALGKAPFVAAKNVYYPEKNEINAVEYYINNFVWGKLQRTDKEKPYPYGIYGTPNWLVNRDTTMNFRYTWSPNSIIKNTGRDTMHIWRAYDYPHIFMLYYNMYQIANKYPDQVTYLDAEGYLERAFQTAKAFFLYPYEIRPWEYKIYELGFYNELVILDIISALELTGKFDDADWLRNEFEKKVKFFIYDNQYPYGSEFSFDRTAFESTYALAKYGVLHKMKPDRNLWFDKNLGKWWSHPTVKQEDARNFMERQHYAGLSVRGWLETNYYKLGADKNMSYMSKMGGWSILDYGINFAVSPYDWLQLGYASYLSSWALMNSGTTASGYGFWAPDKENDGAIGGEFVEAKRGRTWLGREMDRGAWNYDGEADLGLGAGMRMAATILTDDPLFGWVAYGGQLKVTANAFQITPEDGLNCRFSLVTDECRMTISLNRDGFEKNHEIIVDKSLEKITFYVQARTTGPHLTRLSIIDYQRNPKKPIIVEISGKERKLNQLTSGEYYVDLFINNVSQKVVLKL